MSDNAIDRASALRALFRPSSVAVVGASADPTKTGGRPVNYLIKHGFEGKIYPINPKVGGGISGLKCYASVADLPEAPDAAIVLLGAERAHVAVRQLAERGHKARDRARQRGSAKRARLAGHARRNCFVLPGRCVFLGRTRSAPWTCPKHCAVRQWRARGQRPAGRRHLSRFPERRNSGGSALPRGCPRNRIQQAGDDRKRG
jgi:predicted CoA-binding protein